MFSKTFYKFSLIKFSQNFIGLEILSHEVAQAVYVGLLFSLNFIKKIFPSIPNQD